MAPIFEIDILFDKNDVDDYYLSDFYEEIEDKANYMLSDYGNLTLNRKYLLNYNIDKSYFRITRDYEVEYDIRKSTDNDFRRKVVDFCKDLFIYFEVYDGIEIDLRSI